MHLRKQSGYTLASLSVALLVIALLYWNIRGDTDVRMRSLDYDTVVYSAELLGQATNAYYTANCGDGAGMITPTVNDLVNEGYLRSPDVIVNKLEIALTPQIIDPGTDDSMIFIVGNASSVEVAQQLVDMAPNASRIDSAVTFSFKPSRNTSTNEARVSELRTYFGESYCI